MATVECNSRMQWEIKSKYPLCIISKWIFWNIIWNPLLLFDTGRNDELLTLHHVFQFTQIAHVVDLPAKLKTTKR